MELQNIIDIIVRRKRLIALVFLAIFVSIVICSLLVEYRYCVSAKVLIRSSSASSALLNSLGLSSSNVSSSVEETERYNYIALFTIGPILDRVIDEMHLQRKRKIAQFIEMIPLLDKIIRLKKKTKLMTKEELAESSLLQFFFPRPYIEVSQYEDTDLLEIEATSTDLQEAVTMANTFAKVYIEEEKKLIKNDYSLAKRFIHDNLRQAEKNYLNTLHSLRDFKINEKYVDLDDEKELLIEKLYDLRTEMESNKLDIEDTKATIKNLAEQFKKTPKYEKSNESFSSNLMGLQSQLQTQYINLAAYRVSYTEDFPAILEIKSKIEMLEKLIKEATKKTSSSETFSFGDLYQSLKSSLSQNLSTLAGLESKEKFYQGLIDQYERKLLELPDKSSKYAQINMKTGVAEEIYNTLLTYKFRVELGETIALSKVFLVDPATVPGKPKRVRSPWLFLNAVVATFLGLSIGIGLALFVEYLHPQSSHPQSPPSQIADKDEDVDGAGQQAV